jgi:hypothetical protein
MVVRRFKWVSMRILLLLLLSRRTERERERLYSRLRIDFVQIQTRASSDLAYEYPSFHLLCIRHQAPTYLQRIESLYIQSSKASLSFYSFQSSPRPYSTYISTSSSDGQPPQCLTLLTSVLISSICSADADSTTS